MSFITSIGTANPKHKFSQHQIADFMTRAMGLSSDEAHQLKVLYRASGIETRYSVLEDYGNENFSFYSNNHDIEPFPSSKERMELFQKEAILLSKESAENCLSNLRLRKDEITHLIVASCTGMFAPGLDIELVRELGLRSNVERTSITFMGCYAAFNAIRVAKSFCAQDQNTKVLIVCTELCSIHFQKENNEDNILANALFADGSAALMIESVTDRKPALKIEKSYCDLIPEAEKEMAWTIGDFGFEMKLSAYVPFAIKSGIKKLTESLMASNKIARNDIGYFAIHPGGKKILEAIETELGMKKEDNEFAYSVLKQYGNMSSPTVLFVLQKVFGQLGARDHDKKILSFGFGPGLTLESLILTIHV